MKPKALTEEQLKYLREDDQLTVLEDVWPLILKGDTVTFNHSSEVEGRLWVKQQNTQSFRASKFSFATPYLIEKYPELPEINIGDTVVFIDLGWGVGETDGELLVPMTVEALPEDNLCRYGYRVKLKEFESSVNPKCLRVVKKGTLGEINPERFTSMNQEALALELLQHLESELKGTKCVVAGGAPRNWDFDRHARDLDIYILGNTPLFALKDAMNSFTGPSGEQSKTFRVLGSASHHYHDSHIKQVISTKVGTQKVELIVCDDYIGFDDDPDTHVKYVLDKFNCNLCKIAMDSSGKFIKTPEYKTDKLNGELTYPFYKYEADYHRERSLEMHIPKMMKYFPEFTVVIQQKPEGE